MEVTPWFKKNECCYGDYGCFTAWIAITNCDTHYLEQFNYWFETLFFYHSLTPRWYPRICFYSAFHHSCRTSWTIPMESAATGHKNSPIICQWYVAQGLSIVREQFPGVYCYHYMDDILIATLTKEGLLQIWPELMWELQEFGLQIAPEKVQQQPPWKYLGIKILDQTIQPQTIQFSTKIQILNDAEKLLGMALFRINHSTISTLV